MSKNKNKYRRAKAVKFDHFKLIKQLEEERKLSLLLKEENKKLKCNKTSKEVIDENRRVVCEIVEKLVIEDNFPPAFKEDGEERTIFRSLINSTKTFLYEKVDDLQGFSSFFDNKERKPSHPHKPFTWIENLGEHAVSYLVEQTGSTKDVIKKYISETANVRDKSVGLAEFAHCIIWNNHIRACPDAKGDIDILLSDETWGIWDDKGNGGHMPTIKSHGGKLKTQDKVLGPLYGANWKSKYGTRGNKTLDKNYMPHILEKNPLILKSALEMYSDLREKESTGMGLSDEDKEMIVEFFEENPVKSFKKTPQNVENAKKREQYLCLLLLRRSCIVNNMSGIRFNFYDEETDNISTAFLRPAKMPLKDLEQHLEQINKHLEFKLVKTNKNSNFAYNDGCIKAIKIS